MSVAAGLTGPLPHALLLHLLRQALRPLAHRLERTALRVDRAVGIALAELTLRVSHRLTGAVELIVAAYLEIEFGDADATVLWGVGISESTTQASLRAVVSAVNREARRLATPA